MLNPNAYAFASAYRAKPNPVTETIEEIIRKCQVSEKDIRTICSPREEWFSSPTLNCLLEKWENYNKHIADKDNKYEESLSFILYNVQGLQFRRIEIIDLIHQYQASFIICSEVGNQWSM